MVHGTDEYFVERARCSRRSSLISLALSLFGLGLLAFPAPSLVRRVANDTARFGFEGPEQYVRRITLEHRGRTATLSDVGQLALAASARKGGANGAERARVGQPRPRAKLDGTGENEEDLAAMRSVSRIAGVPVFQSEELVIERLIKPEYPPDLLARNIEGKVTVQALVDTIGNVVEVQLVTSTGEPLFEKAAEEAVWLCRFRPFRPAGETSEVYAVFHFRFRIY